ncbi:MAG: hypothetical protein IJ721_05700 [Bacteroidales bacterium]|nr:hypothetical protein [Bacteroidales bacterium]
MKHIYLYWIPAIILCSCVMNYNTWDVLKGVESFIQKRPDSALKVLNSISPEELGTKKLRARYSLLYATALDKSHILTTDLAIILLATEYYSKYGSPTQRIRAYFHQGCIYANKGEDGRAMYYYLISLEDSSRVADNHYKELINSAISDIFSRNHNNEQEQQYAIEALRYGRKAGDSVVVWAITGHIASCYGNLRRKRVTFVL